MRDRQARLLTILCAALLLLVAILLLAKPPAETSDDAETWSPAFGETVDASSVTAIELSGGPAPLRIRKAEGAWRVGPGPDGAVDAADVRADDRKVEDLARALSELEVGAALEVGDAPLASFGLDAPVVATLARADGAPLVVRVGKDAPVGMRTYVQIGDDAAVRVTRERIRAAVAMTMDDVRDHAVARFEKGDVRRIELGTPAALVLRQDELGWWVSPGAATGELRADEARVRSFLQDVLDVRADEFPAVAAWVDRTPVDALPIRLWLGDDPAPVAIDVDRFGADEWRVSGPEQPAPVRVRMAPLPGMSLGVEPWTATALLPVRDAQLSAVRVETPRASFAASREAERWAPASGAAVVEALAASRVDRSRTVETPTVDPVGRIELVENGTRTQTLVLFPALATGDVPARDREGGPAFVVSASQIDAIERAAAADVHATAEPDPSP
jgi:hypothetical protein